MAPADATVPTVGSNFPTPFGKYLLTELLAVGGMAEVYRAKIFGIDGFEKEMVVKKILPKYAKRQSFVQMFVDEAKIAVALSHGNIVPIYELGEFGGAYYIAMEYVEGPTVLDLLRDCFSHSKALPAAYALYIAAEVAKGLGYAHNKTRADGAELGIVHRDINPRNIVVTPGGEVKILDFGIARASTRRYQTASGVIKGTPGYMSPEQLFGHGVDHRSDLYCLGIILHELLTVRRLFRVKDVNAMRKMVESEPVAPPSTLRGDIEPRLDGLLAKMMAMQPEERFQNAGELEEALRHEIALTGVAVTSRALAQLVEEIQRPGYRQVVRAVDLTSSVPVVSKGPATAPASRPQTSPATRPQTSPATRPATEPGNGGAPAKVEDVLSEAPFEAPPRAPRPHTQESVVPAPADAGFSGPRPKTAVLAVNEDIGWARKIGDDAELLAIAKATGLKPRSVLKTLIIPLLLVLAVLGAIAFLGREQIPHLWRRIVEQRDVRLGSIIVKTYPSGAEVTVDGRRYGVTPLRVDNIDVDGEHDVVISPVGEPEIKRFVGPGDWEGEEGEMQVEIKVGYDKLPEGVTLEE